MAGLIRNVGLRLASQVVAKNAGVVSTASNVGALRLASTASDAKENKPTIRKPNETTRSHLSDFGRYVAECLPKYVQKVQLTSGDELEVLIAPEGVVPVL
ncbi:NADH dehydrogenase [ubiquinone] iron-sulfur protein 3, mitochondrial-like [Musca autumnalis]